MRKHKKGRIFFLTVFLATVMVFPHLPAEAAGNEADAYTYTVTFLPGDKGVFDTAEIAVTVERDGAAAGVDAVKGEEKIVVSGLQYGDRVSITPDVKTDSSMYYVRGIRKAGYDNNDAAAMLASNTVEHDTEYVVAYGVPGEMVHYTVRYVDEEGNALLSERVYQGKLGDTPVAGYIYIEGYEPRAYNLTKTLVADENENIFTFVYNRLPSGTAGGGTTTTTTVVTTTVTVPVAGEGGIAEDGAADADTVPEDAEALADTDAVPGGGGVAGAGGAAGGDAGAGGAGEEPVELEDEEVPEAGPEELVNLDDEETPLAKIKPDEKLRPVSYMVVLFALAGAELLAVGYIVLFMKKRKKEEAEKKDEK